MKYYAGHYDVAVIGAGHAGIEAGLAAARLGCKTAVFTISADWVGNMPCNPAIGGTSKGHLVREIDALGGEMAIAADKNLIQSRMLNLGKGPAVHSPRAQIDRRDYSAYMKRVLESTENLDLRQGEIVDLAQVHSDALEALKTLPTTDAEEALAKLATAQKEGEVHRPLWQVTTQLEAVYTAETVILATGTFLGGRIYVGDVSYAAVPDGLFPATDLAVSLQRLGVQTGRFKTGTPSRVNARSVDLDKLEVQYGDEKLVRFSDDLSFTPENKAVCYITYTGEETKEIILANLERSPLYGGKIEGIGPRYCPSIEDKIVRFPEKERHQIFIEPCGLHTEELYLQGLSSSLPEDVQLKFLRTIPGLEHVQVIRTAYAIEYDCVDPTSLFPSLEFKDFPGLFGAGQFNGSSGYEEAAAQGLIAGINAALKVQGKEPFTLDRASSYIGTLIDDLVTKGCNEPYRMMTSRSEYRLILRQDNADQRLLRYGYELGLVSKERYDALLEKEAYIAEEIERARKVVISPTEAVNAVLVSRETSPIDSGVKLADLLKRPQLNYDVLEPFDTTRPLYYEASETRSEATAAYLNEQVFFEAETELKYEGYIKRQKAQVKEMRRLEEVALPEGIDYTAIDGLRLEAREKLARIKPRSIGQASRISGVSPADISVLLIYLEKERHA